MTATHWAEQQIPFWMAARQATTPTTPVESIVVAPVADLGLVSVTLLRYLWFWTAWHAFFADDCEAVAEVIEIETATLE